MMWLFLALIAYFLFAFSSLTDRYLLEGSLPHPRAYAFYTGVTGILASVLIPWGFHIPSGFMILIALSAGVVSVLGLYASYRAIFHSGVTRIVPMVGALFPIFTLLLTWLIHLDNVSISLRLVEAFMFFTAGTILLSLHGRVKDFHPSWFDISNSILIGFLFALGFVMAKYVYNAEGFISGFVWMRWGGFLTSVSFLAFPITRAVVFKKDPVKKRGVYLPFLFGKGAGSAAFLLQQYAISISENFQLSIISALQGVQYGFLLLFVGVLSFWRPKLLKEELQGANIIWRALGIGLIGIGFYLFAF